MKFNKFENLKQALNLKADPIGVKLIYEHNKNLQSVPKFKGVVGLGGYCEYVKKASQGEFLKIQKGDFSCHTGNIVLGFKESDNLELTMSLDVKGLKYILVFPINKYQLEDYDYCKEYQMELAISLLVGYPYESLESIKNMIDFLKLIALQR